MSTSESFDELYNLSEPFLRTICTSRNLPITGSKCQLVYSLLRADYTAAKSHLAQLKSSQPDPVADFFGNSLFEAIVKAACELHRLQNSIWQCALKQLDIKFKALDELGRQRPSPSDLRSAVADARSEWEEWTDCGFTR